MLKIMGVIYIIGGIAAVTEVYKLYRKDIKKGIIDKNEVGIFDAALVTVFVFLVSWWSFWVLRRNR